jgi:hypothetical protein
MYLHVDYFQGSANRFGWGYTLQFGGYHGNHENHAHTAKYSTVSKGSRM